MAGSPLSAHFPCPCRKSGRDHIFIPNSGYYVRGHVSYESPLLALSWVPYVGNFVESERLYFSIMSIEHVKGYMEAGYGFKCKYFSTAFFASFLDMRYHSLECKFTIELFNRW